MNKLLIKRKELVTVCGASLIFIILGVMILLPQESEVPEVENQELDSSIEWQQMYGGSKQDWAYSIQQTNDQGYIIVGVSESTDIAGCTNHGGDDIYILKLDFNGTVEWQQLYGGSNGDYAYVILQTIDGGFILVGESDSTDIQGCTNNGGFDGLIIKLDPFGKVEWQQMYGGNNNDLVISIRQLANGSFIAAGESRSTNIPGCSNNGGADVFVLKLDSNGTIEQQQLYGGENDDRALSIQQTSDNGFIVFGSSNSQLANCTNHGDYDFYALKLDEACNITWQQMYGGSSREWGFSIEQTADGGYIACGLSDSTDIAGCSSYGDWDSYVIKLDSNGNLLWQKKFGGSSMDLSYEIKQTTEGYIALGGSWSDDIQNCTNHGERDYYLFKIDSTGAVEWQKLYGGSKIDYASSFDLTSDGGLIISGGSGSKNIPGVTNQGEWDVFIIKLKACSVYG